MFIDELKAKQKEWKEQQEKDKREWEEKRRKIKIDNFLAFELGDIFNNFKIKALEAVRNNKNFVNLASSSKIFDEDLKPYVIEFFTQEGFKIEYNTIEREGQGMWGTDITMTECKISW